MNLSTEVFLFSIRDEETSSSGRLVSVKSKVCHDDVHQGWQQCGYGKAGLLGDALRCGPRVWFQWNWTIIHGTQVEMRMVSHWWWWYRRLLPWWDGPRVWFQWNRTVSFAGELEFVAIVSLRTRGSPWSDHWGDHVILFQWNLILDLHGIHGWWAAVADVRDDRVACEGSRLVSVK